MRPIRRGNAPRPNDYADYKDAKPDLVARLGPYCSFCERPVVTQLAVDHIQPKGLPAYAHLIGRWSNFLLACVNCNSTKKDKDVDPANALLPDRDNTFAAFQYLPDGTVEPSANATDNGLNAIADGTLRLTGLHKAALNTPDENGKQVALDRKSQRMEAWLAAEEAKRDLQNHPANHVLCDYIIKLAAKTGFFSVWMTVFADNPTMLSRLIDAFTGTSGSGCFAANGDVVSPAPNPDALPGGGKI
ncbi:HNH endonuclease [Sedimenticola hydrogenitrophicus]|uniref:HNH endonuclease n=1 Tax=Sedimenticola hydrogenitrophicus TaxID=2967975 RepID=UPI0023B01995|nr:HNH endonuclease [Sedimenticola hydrogenitrophicus]